MSGLRRSLLLAALLLAALLLGLGAPSVGAAQEPEPAADAVDFEALRKDRRIKQSKYPPSRRISRYLAAAAEAADEGDPAKGKALLAKLKPSRLNPHERAMVYRLTAFISYGEGDFEGTIENFEKVIAEEVMPIEVENKIRFNIAQLHAGQQQWQETLDALTRWFHYAEEPDPLAHYLMAMSYFQLEQIDASLEHAEKAVDFSEEPGEGFLQLLAALYIQKEDYPSAAPVFEELVLRFPKKAYWVQLSLIYGARDNFRGSLAVQQVAYLQGLLTEDKELRRLARSYLFHDLPYPAAQVLENGLENDSIEANADAYELLANSWISAREYESSLPPLVKAAELSDDGNLFMRLGQVYLQREAWLEAAASLEKAVEKGGLKNPGNAELLLGIAYYNGERVAQARSSFERARGHDETRTEAEGWITHMQRELEGGESEES